MIKAPYNFVPLNKEVFYPDWSEEVSHDIPFSDGESGEIEIKITSKSPIFIRDSEDEKEFCNYNGNYFIPGSSVKGMIRNILEVISFSKMNFFDDKTYAVRDLSSAKNFYMTEMQKEVVAGWLFYDENNKLKIEDCGIPLRISHQEIDKALNIDFASNFSEGLFNPRNNDEKTAEYKYNLINGPYQTIRVGKPYISEKNPKYDKRKFCKFDKNGEEGILVLTGQPTARKNNGQMGDGKGFEFVFMTNQDELEVPQKVFDNFKFAYFDERNTEPQESPDLETKTL